VYNGEETFKEEIGKERTAQEMKMREKEALREKQEQERLAKQKEAEEEKRMAEAVAAAAKQEEERKRIAKERMKEHHDVPKPPVYDPQVRRKSQAEQAEAEAKKQAEEAAARKAAEEEELNKKQAYDMKRSQSLKKANTFLK
jgi:hypothetical protein